MAGNLFIKEQAGAITVDVLVVPRSSREELGPIAGDRLKVFLTAPPVDGKANHALISFIAQCLGVRKQDVTIIIGEKGKRKTIRVMGVGREKLLSLVPAFTQRG